MVETLLWISILVCFIGIAVLLWQLHTRICEIEQHLRAHEWRDQQREYSE